MEIHRSPVIIAGQPRSWAKGSVVRGARGFILLSGDAGIDVNTGKIPETAGEQARVAMENIKARLGEYGSSLENILFVRRYVKGEFPNGIASDPIYQEIVKAMEEFWRENCPEFLSENNPPASTLIGVASLAFKELLLEIEVVAAIA